MGIEPEAIGKRKAHGYVLNTIVRLTIHTGGES